jgi:hypothetical protein
VPPTLPNLAQLVAAIPQHTEGLSPESERPIEHYRRGASDAWNLWQYFARNVQRANIYRTAYERHAARLRSLVLLNIIESFERFIKELAAVCVDHVAPLVLDDRDRFKEFSLRPSGIAGHFADHSIGKALCEGQTWLDCDDIDKRFRRLLANPFESGNFRIFDQPNSVDGWRRNTADTIFQLRHVITHNISVITRSDAAKLSLLVKENVESLKLLTPTEPDVRSVKRFLDDTCRWMNQRVGTRLAELLTTVHADNPAAFDPQDRANLVTNQFTIVFTVAGATGALR